MEWSAPVSLLKLVNTDLGSNCTEGFSKAKFFKNDSKKIVVVIRMRPKIRRRADERNKYRSGALRISNNIVHVMKT